MKILHLTEKIYTGTACGACDKYEVCGQWTGDQKNRIKVGIKFPHPISLRLLAFVLLLHDASFEIRFPFALAKPIAFQ